MLLILIIFKFIINSVGLVKYNNILKLINSNKSKYINSNKSKYINYKINVKNILLLLKSIIKDKSDVEKIGINKK